LKKGMDAGARSACFGGKAVTLKSQKQSTDAVRDDDAKRAFKLLKIPQENTSGSGLEFCTKFKT
jgi:hypothetical protein